MTTDTYPHGTFISAIDGPVQRPIRPYLQELWQVPCLDSVTCIDPIGLFSLRDDVAQMEHIYGNLEFSFRNVPNKRLAFVGHRQPEMFTDEVGQELVRECCAVLQVKFQDVDVIGLWVDPDAGTVLPLD